MKQTTRLTRFFESKCTFFNLLFILFFSLSFISIYFNFVKNGLITIGNDNNFHTLRIEDYTLALRSGHLFSYINNIALFGTGYAAPIFYSNFFLLPAAIIHIFIPMAPTVILFLLLINLTTFYIAYWSFYRCFFQRSSSLTFSIFFTLSTYRLAEITPRFALGELIALIFLPLAFSTLYRTIVQHSDDWLSLSLSVSGILLAHHITALIFVLFGGLFLLFFWQEITSNTWKSLIKACIAILLLTAFYTAPLIEQLLSQKFYMQIHPIFSITNNVPSLIDILTTALKVTKQNQISIGFIALSILGCSWLSVFYLNNIQKKLLIISTLFLILCTNMAPWNLLATTPLSYLQFPWRLFSIISLIVAWLLADYVRTYKLSTHHSAIYASLLLLPVFFILLSQMSPNTLSKKNYAEYNQVYISRNGLQGAEFLPANLNENQLYQLNQTTKPKHIYNKWYFSKNELSNQHFVPVLWYKGYQIIDSTGKIIPFREGSGMLYLVNNPSDDITVTYIGTYCQKIALLISIVSLILIFLYQASSKINPNKKKVDCKVNPNAVRTKKFKVISYTG